MCFPMLPHGTDLFGVRFAHWCALGRHIVFLIFCWANLTLTLATYSMWHLPFWQHKVTMSRWAYLLRHSCTYQVSLSAAAALRVTGAFAEGRTRENGASHGAKKQSPQTVTDSPCKVHLNTPNRPWLFTMWIPTRVSCRFQLWGP